MDFEQAADQALRQPALVVADRRHPGHHRFPAAAIRVYAAEAPPDPRDVLDRGRRARHALVVLRPGLETPGQIVVRRPHFVHSQFFQVLALAVQQALVRPEELVGRAGQEVAIERLDVDGAVRSEMHRVHEYAGPDGVGEAHDGLHVVDRAHRVGGVAHSDELRPPVDG